jgi:membrane fusion protein, multidrug efflux system
MLALESNHGPIEAANEMGLPSAGRTGQVEPPVGQGVPSHSRRWRWLLSAAVILAGLAAGGLALGWSVNPAPDTIATNDAYVNGHVTLVAPRVSGRVSRALVDDNHRVKKGDLLVQLDQAPYQAQVQIKAAAVAAAEADVAAAQAQVRGLLAQAGANRWKLENAVGQVDNQVALLKARVAALRSAEADRELSAANLARAKTTQSALSPQEYDTFVAARKVADAKVGQALEDVNLVRSGLGLLPAAPGADPAAVPADVNQRFSAVREALAGLIQAQARVGLPLPDVEATPRQFLDACRKLDPEGGTSNASSSGSSRQRRPSGRPRPRSFKPAATWGRRN